VKVTPSDELKFIGSEDDGLQLLPPELAGAILGGIVCGLIAYDLRGFIAWISG
jgi:hypothetical protein